MIELDKPDETSGPTLAEDTAESRTLCPRCKLFPLQTREEKARQLCEMCHDFDAVAVASPGGPTHVQVVGISVPLAGITTPEELAHRIAEVTHGSHAGARVLLPSGRAVRVRQTAAGWDIEELP